MPLNRNQPIGLARLMRQNVAGTDMTPLATSLLKQAEADPDNASALLDASVILQFYSQVPLALQLQTEALKVQRTFHQPSAKTARLRLLCLMAPGNLMANVPVECLLEDSDIDLCLHYIVHPGEPLADLPVHDVLFVAICETEANRPTLQALVSQLADWHRPVINRPERIPNVARDTAAQLLHHLPGVCMPPTWRLHREALVALADPEGERAAQAHGLAYPLIVRPIDSHAGNDLHKVDSPADLAQVLPTLPGDEGFVAPFVDYRSRDGQFRKYRVMLIDGQPYIAHAAISSHWMIHYLNAGMADSAEKRAEEATFMARFDTDFAVRHAEALRAIHQAVGLDYLGLDCAEMPDGRLLVFEIDHAMVVHAMDPVDLYPYKQPVMRHLFAGFRALLFRAAGLATEPLAH